MSGRWSLVAQLLLVLAAATSEHIMYAGGSFQSLSGVPGTTGIVKLTARGSEVEWSSVGNGVYSPNRRSVVNAIVMLDAPNQLLAGGDFVMAGSAERDNIDNQTVPVYSLQLIPWTIVRKLAGSQASWGFAHFDGQTWQSGYKGLRMVASSDNKIHTMLHTHVYDSEKYTWKEHILIGGQFYAQADSRFFANFAHYNGEGWVGLTSDLSPTSSSLPITVIQKYGAPTSGGPRDKAMIGGTRYFRFYDLARERLERQCASDEYNFLSLTTVCNGWVYAATDGSEGSRRFNYNDCAGIQLGEQLNSTWVSVPERSAGCALNQVSQVMCVKDSLVVAVGKFKMPGYRAAVYDTRHFAKSHSATRPAVRGRFLHTNESFWQGHSACCKQQESCTTVCESECAADQQPFPALLAVAQNIGEDGVYWVAGERDSQVAGGSTVARVQMPDVTSSEAQLLRMDTGEYQFDGAVSTIQAKSGGMRLAPMSMWMPAGMLMLWGVVSRVLA